MAGVYYQIRHLKVRNLIGQWTVVDCGQRRAMFLNLFNHSLNLFDHSSDFSWFGTNVRTGLPVCKAHDRQYDCCYLLIENGTLPTYKLATFWLEAKNPRENACQNALESALMTLPLPFFQWQFSRWIVVTRLWISSRDILNSLGNKHHVWIVFAFVESSRRKVFQKS